MIFVKSAFLEKYQKLINFEWIFGGPSDQNSNKIAKKFVYFFDVVFMPLFVANSLDFGRSEEDPERPGAVPRAFSERPERLPERLRRILGHPGAFGFDFWSILDGFLNDFRSIFDEFLLDFLVDF